MSTISKARLFPPPRKIFIVEDHPVFREGLAQSLNSETDLQVCGTAGDVPGALRSISRLEPDLVLVDISLPGESGLELIKKLRLVDRKIKLLVVSMHNEALYADRVLKAGGDGYIMKQEDPEEILNAIRDVLGGYIYVSDEILGAASSAFAASSAKEKERPLAQLTDSELELLQLFGQGKSNEEIASESGLSAKAVALQSAQLKKKLKLKSDNALIRYAVCWVEKGEV